MIAGEPLAFWRISRSRSIPLASGSRRSRRNVRRRGALRSAAGTPEAEEHTDTSYPSRSRISRNERPMFSSSSTMRIRFSYEGKAAQCGKAAPP